MKKEILQKRAKFLRTNMTDAEKLIWYHLRNRHLTSLKFRRQVVLGDYIVDFYCAEKRLVLEVDGGQHLDQVDYDNKRANFLAGIGCKVIRFWNDDVLIHTDDVLEQILRACTD